MSTLTDVKTIEHALARLKNALDHPGKEAPDYEKVHKVLLHCQTFVINEQLLRKTSIGKNVGICRKASDPKVAHLATMIVDTWRAHVKQEKRLKAAAAPREAQEKGGSAATAHHPDTSMPQDSDVLMVQNEVQAIRSETTANQPETSVPQDFDVVMVQNEEQPTRVETTAHHPETFAARDSDVVMVQNGGQAIREDPRSQKEGAENQIAVIAEAEQPPSGKSASPLPHETDVEMNLATTRESTSDVFEADTVSPTGHAIRDLCVRLIFDGLVENIVDLASEFAGCASRIEEAIFLNASRRQAANDYLNDIRYTYLVLADERATALKNCYAESSADELLDILDIVAMFPYSMNFL
ncbi:hypothetical protein FISHEDRAFT_77355 [Fistulina hepatica ATCC 64428]|uniref:TFIIS N-terminal domain-containing protein n=1 Tax=Fistulina hepatica ATCC 64428 TaxID=1128425 RepID=A0A0D7A116_9AGAR|nr:hypothetical protein FISHEDRAFT_77355 [Fistulina hepatica ATCC 64428]